MANHVVKKGLDIPIAGAASGVVIELPTPVTVAYAPTEFRGVIPRLAAREGDKVKRGTPVLHSKADPEMVFLSPVSGTVKEVRRGRRRVITDFVIEVQGDEAESLKAYSLADLKSLDRDTARSAVLASGWWPSLRTRPLSNVAAPDVVPQSIVISGSETGPLQPGAAELIGDGDKDALQAAVYALKALTDGGVHLTKLNGDTCGALSGIDGATEHTFAGPHPAGDASVQVNLIDPPRGSNQVWYLNAWDAVSLGHTLLKGEFHADRVVAAIGTGTTPRFVKTILGAPLKDIAGETKTGDLRWIRGSVLTGEAVDGDRWSGFYARAVHVLPDEVERRLLGWAMPSLGEWSFHKAFFKGWFGGSKNSEDMRPGVYGGIRAIVPIGVYGDVIATPDIMPSFLFKSIVANDLEESIQLGLLDLTEEEAALCTYICPSKIEFDVLLRQGLELYEQEA